MNYEKIYFSIIENSKFKTKDIGLEKHHILPKSCGGTNDEFNLVYLTTREHFICHLLLVKMYKNNPTFRKKMIYALWWMAKTRSGYNSYVVTSHAYAEARKRYIDENPNKCEERKRRFSENHKLGKYQYDYNKVSNTLKNTLSKLSKEEMHVRMKASVGQCDQKTRGNMIRKGKGSQMQLTKMDGSIIKFWSYEQVMFITGYTYDHIKYKIKKCNGQLNDGSVVKYVTKYTGNDKSAGRKRNNGL